MNHYSRIIELLQASGATFSIFEHPPCRTSEESRVARLEAGAGDTVGAKALLVALKGGGFATLVLPGGARLDNKLARAVVGAHSFATPQQMLEVTDGLTPGTMPPFGPHLFSGIDKFVVDPILSTVPRIGFNAGETTRSIVMCGSDYLTVAGPECIVESISKAD